MKKDAVIMFCYRNKVKLALGIFLVMLVIVPLAVSSNYVLHVINIALLFAFPSIGLTILAGYTGQVTMCQATFFGLGAYFVGILAKAGWNFWVAIFLAPIFVGVIAMVIGAPAIRLKGHYLVLLSIAYAEIATIFAQRWKPLTGGPDGLIAIPIFKFFGLNMTSERNFYFLIVIMVALMLTVVTIFSRSGYGVAMKTIKQDPIAAEMVGISVRKQKLVSFIICGAVAGMGGGLYAAYVGFVSPEIMTRGESIMILAMVTIGGMGNLVGGVLGAFIVSVLPESLRVFNLYYQLVFSLVIVLVMIYMPKGVSGLFLNMVRTTRQRYSLRKADVTEPAKEADGTDE